ncbi:MAG: hypothetical protein K2I81_04560 [Alphaproteobacteria bacterium]|nr:hypothetical protein [Alphaproteobacteria bacterium]
MNNIANLYRIGCEALASGDIDIQRRALAYIEANVFSTTKSAALTYIKNIYTCVEVVPINQLRSECVTDNLRAYCQALWDETHIGMPRVNFIAIERLQNIKHFEADTVLYYSNNGVLTTSDLLKLVGRALSCVQLITGVDTSKARQATTALKGLELLLSNKHGKLDEIGYAVEVFGAISEQMTTNQAIKQNILGAQTTLSLALDFFSDTKKRQQ